MLIIIVNRIMDEQQYQLDFFTYVLNQQPDV
jgi:hypothetical protein